MQVHFNYEKLNLPEPKPIIVTYKYSFLNPLKPKIMKQICAIFVLLLLSSPTRAQWSLVDKPELSSVEYEYIVYTGSAVLLANESGVFRSADNGATWTLSVSGLDTTYSGVHSMTFIGPPRNETWITTGSGIYKSTDHGLTWSKATINGLQPGMWLDRLSSFGTRLLAIMNYSYWENDLLKQITYLAHSDNGTDWTPGALLTEDGASWWQFVNHENSRAAFLVEEPNDNTAPKLWSTTNGNTIQPVPVTGLPGSPKIRARSLSIEPAGNNLLFTNEGEPAYYRFNFGIQAWEKKMNGIELTGYGLAMAFRAHSLEGLILATALFADVSMNLEMRLFKSTDNGENWTVVSDPGIDFPIFESKMVQTSTGRILGAHFNSSLVTSDNGGNTWSKAPGIQAGDFNQFRALSDGTLVLISQDQTKGIIKSTDNGETWTSANGNLADFIGIYLVEDIRGAGNYVYALAAENPFGEKLFLFLNQDLSAGVWNKITTTPDSANIWFSGMNGIWPIYFLSNDDDQGTYQMTKDAGASWVNLSTAIAPLNLDRVYGFRGNASGGKLFLFGQKNNKTRVYLSENEGLSFFDITSNIDGPQYDIVISDQWDWDDVAKIMADFRADGKFLLAAWDYNIFPAEIRFYMLDDTEDLWVQQGTEGIKGDYQIRWNNLRFNGGVWYLASSAGVLASINNCSTWQPVWNNQGYPTGTRAASFVMNNYGAYMGTRGAGVWRAQLTAPTLTTLEATHITDTTANSGATIVSTGGLPFGGKGLCWALTENPTTANFVVYSGNSWASYTDTMRLLQPNTTYYARAYVMSPKGGGQPVYGNQISFKTDNLTRIITENAARVVLYPNPSDGRFSIEAETVTQLTVLDVGGRIVHSERVNPGINNISLKKPAAGIYFVRLTGNNGITRVEQLIVK